MLTEKEIEGLELGNTVKIEEYLNNKGVNKYKGKVVQVDTKSKKVVLLGYKEDENKVKLIKVGYEKNREVSKGVINVKVSRSRLVGQLGKEVSTKFRMMLEKKLTKNKEELIEYNALTPEQKVLELLKTKTGMNVEYKYKMKYGNKLIFLNSDGAIIISEGSAKSFIIDDLKHRVDLDRVDGGFEITHLSDEEEEEDLERLWKPFKDFENDTNINKHMLIERFITFQAYNGPMEIDVDYYIKIKNKRPSKEQVKQYAEYLYNKVIKQ